MRLDPDQPHPTPTAPPARALGLSVLAVGVVTAAVAIALLLQVAITVPAPGAGSTPAAAARAPGTGGSISGSGPGGLIAAPIGSISGASSGPSPAPFASTFGSAAGASASGAPAGPSPAAPAPASGPGVAASTSPAASAPPAPPGSFAQFNLPAPWVGGTSPWANVWVYTPAGYATSPGTRYPVLYEVPWGGDGWEAGIHVRERLDALIARGTLPPSLVVFVNQARGPYRPSECADSYDGREHFDSYVAQTVVPWVDARYRTIRAPLARTLIGFSQGGYCAPILLFHHPDVFGNAISFSGYYVAGIWSPETRSAYAPFGHDQALIAADSPMVLAGRLPDAVRQRLFLVLVGTPSEPFFGPQLTSFAQVLAADGYHDAVLDSPVGHSWAQVRTTLPAALAALTQHQQQAGLFGGASG